MATLPHALRLCLGDGVLRGPYKLDERLDLEASPADQGAVDVLLGHDISSVFRLDVATVEDADSACEIVSRRLPQQVPDLPDGVLGVLGGSAIARPYGPDRLVGEY